jgi:hypothetical protein
MDMAKVYPYVVPEGYFQLPPQLAKRQPPVPDGFRLPLGHEIYAILVEDEGNAIRSVRPDELEEAQLTPQKAHAAAVDNLARFAEPADSFKRSIQKGAFGIPFLYWAGDWRAAACCLLPGMYGWISGVLKTTELCVSFPVSQVLFVFPQADREYREEMRKFVRNFAEDLDKIITFEWFSLTADGLRPFSENP